MCIGFAGGIPAHLDRGRTGRQDASNARTRLKTAAFPVAKTLGPTAVKLATWARTGNSAAAWLLSFTRRTTRRAAISWRVPVNAV
jgi:hypothetical protein